MNASKKKTSSKKKLKEKIDTIEKLAMVVADGFTEVYERMGSGFAEVHERFDDVYSRFDAVDARFDAVDSSLTSIRKEIRDIDARLGHLEEQGAMQSGYAKEIDYLLEQVARIKQHLNLA